MIQINPTYRYTVAGLPGQGKTVFARHIIKQLKTSGVDTVIYDPMAQYTDLDSYVPKYFATEYQMPEFDDIAMQIWDKRNVFFVVEEVENFLPQAGRRSGIMWRIINMGRNYGLGVLAVTRRISNMDKTMFSLSDKTFIFRLFSPNDLEYCRGFIGKSADTLLPKLKCGYYLQCTSTAVTLHEPVPWDGKGKPVN